MGSLTPTEPRNLADVFPNASPEALEHPYVEQFHDPANEPACEFIIQIAISDDQKLSIKEYRDALYKDVIAGSRRHRKSKTAGLTADAKEKKERKAERKEKKERKKEKEKK